MNLLPLAGLEVNLQVILSNPHALFRRERAILRMQESDFLKEIIKVEDLEQKARNCTQVSIHKYSKIFCLQVFVICNISCTWLLVPQIFEGNVFKFINAFFQVLVWHTHTEKVIIGYEVKDFGFVVV